MQVNKVLKGLAVVLPMFTLAACSSTTSNGTTDSMPPEMTESSTSTLVTPVKPGQDNFTEEEIRNNQLRQSHTVLFTYDTFSVLPQYEDVLDAHAQFLLENPKVIVVVEGHTDERGTPEYNISLGERRANAVARYLQALGVPASQMNIVSYGEEKPLVLGHTEEDYKKNRRAVLIY